MPTVCAANFGSDGALVIYLTASLDHTVTLTVTSPSPRLAATLDSAVLATDTVATLTVTDAHTGTLLPGLWYTVPITGIGGGFTPTVNVSLLVGGGGVYLPLVARE